MYIISWNINGLNSRFEELQQLIAEHNPDFVCLQKVRYNGNREKFSIDGYHAFSSSIDSGSWSGVMTYFKIPKDTPQPGLPHYLPERVQTPGLSSDGHLQVFRCKDFFLINAYVPFANNKLDGGVAFRQHWDNEFRNLIVRLSYESQVIICGDLNVVHTDKDSCEHQLEQNRPNFSKWERDNFNTLLREANLADAFREKHPDKNIPTFYGNYRHTNIGNRIDYFLISRSLLPDMTASDILSYFGSSQSVPITLNITI